MVDLTDAAHRPTCKHGVSVSFGCNECSIAARRTVVVAKGLGASRVEQWDAAAARGALPWWALGATRAFILSGACNCKTCKESRELILRAEADG